LDGLTIKINNDLFEWLKKRGNVGISKWKFSVRKTESSAVVFDQKEIFISKEYFGDLQTFLKALEDFRQTFIKTTLPDTQDWTVL
jgi:hypothetical protein